MPNVISSKIFSQHDVTFAIVNTPDSKGDKFKVHKNETVLLSTRDLNEAKKFFNGSVATFQDLI